MIYICDFKKCSAIQEYILNEKGLKNWACNLWKRNHVDLNMNWLVIRSDPNLGPKNFSVSHLVWFYFYLLKYILLYSPIDEKSNEVITLSLKFLLVIKSVASEFCKKSYKTQSKSLHFNVFYWWSLTSEECKSRGADMQRELAVQTSCYCKSLFFATTHSLSQSVSQSVTPSQ